MVGLGVWGFGVSGFMGFRHRDHPNYLQLYGLHLLFLG